MRYATKAVTLDGKSYNAGDIIPDEMGDRAGAEKWSRAEGEPIPTPEAPKEGVTSESFSATAEVQDEDEEVEETEDEEESVEDEETTEDDSPEEETEEEADSTEESEKPAEEEAPKKGWGRRKKK